MFRRFRTVVVTAVAAVLAAPAVPAAAGTPGCHIDYWMRPASTGFLAIIDIHNTGDGTIYGWTLRFQLPPGQRIVRGYEATFTDTNGDVVAQNLPHNGVVDPRESVRVGFDGAGEMPRPVRPRAFTVNGRPCTT